MKICLLTAEMNIQAGTERIILTHADELKKKGYDISIACMYLEPNVFPKRFKKYKIIEYDKESRKVKRGQRIIYPLRMAKQNIDFLKDFDLIICYRPGTNIMAMKVKKKFGIPIIWYCSHPMKHLYPKYFYLKGKKDWLVHYALLPIKKIDKESFAFFDRIYVNSHHMWTKINLIYGIDNHMVLYPPAGKIFPKSKSKGKHIMCLSRIAFEKNQLVLLKALKKLKDKPRVLFIGKVINKSYKNELISFAEKYNINIKFIEKADDKLIENYYNKSFVNIYTPYDEDFGIVPLESLSANTPCLTHISNGVSEVLPLRFVFTNVDELSNKIVHIKEGKMKKLGLKENGLAKTILKEHINQIIEDINKIRKKLIK